MKCQIHLLLLNEHFSVEHAEANHDGKESEMNRKYEWEDEILVKGDVSDVTMFEKANYPLQGVRGDGESFSIDVKGMRLFEIKSENAPFYVGCSESILEEYKLDKSDEGFVLKIYIKDFEPMSNPVPGIFIAAQEFPKELIE